ncbi:ABC transporter permease [Oscillospiraceae bacterium]|nr:ABC transporter permease [Oscillospiraceae bacterium]BDF75405.1 ABC transporter permease [Oscillospiraceae bacterium]
MKQESKFGRFLRAPGTVSALSSVLAILIGLLIGFLLLLIFNPGEALGGMVKLLTTGFKNPARFAKVLYQAAPLVMTGLSVGFAFKTGLFNIGASGQYVVGSCCALVTGVAFGWPWWASMIAAMIGGAVWGLFPGLFKALFNVNEVITSIMFNWIGLFLTNLIFSNIPQMLANFWGDAQYDRTAALAKANPGAIIPTAGLDQALGSTYMNISIFITIFFAIVIYIVLNKTTFGYELKACGQNRNAAVYAGINAKRNIVLSMVIAGAMSGIAGGIYYLAGTAQYVMDKVLPAMGFNGIPVALLASSNPIGTIFSALFISYIQVGGEAMQPKFATETIDIIIAVIIYLAAFSLLMKNLISKAMTRRKQEAAAPAQAPADGKEEQK